MAGPNWNYVLKFIITGAACPPHLISSPMIVLTPLRLCAFGALQAMPEWESLLSLSDLPTNVSWQILTQQFVLISYLPPITDKCLRARRTRTTKSSASSLAQS